MAVQPDGAIRSLSAGSFSDAKFSRDGSKLFGVSGGAVRMFDVASGALLATYTLGGTLGGMDLSADGRYLAVVQLDQGSRTVHRVDLQSGVATSYQVNVYGQSTQFFDVALLPDGDALLSQQGYALFSNYLVRFDFETGASTLLPQSVPQNATLVASDDGSRVVIQPPSPTLQITVYDANTGELLNRIPNPDPYAGASVPSASTPVQAISPDGTAIVQGTGLYVYDRALNPILSLLTEYPEVANVDGLAFSGDGTTLYVLDHRSARVYLFDSSDWSLAGSYPIGATLPSGTRYYGDYGGLFGDVLQVSADGRYLSITAESSLQIIDTSKAISDGGTDGADVLTGSGVIYGFGGDDVLTSDGGATPAALYGGAGDDTFYLNAWYDYANDSATDAGYDIIYSNVATGNPYNNIYSIQIGVGIEDLVLRGGVETYVTGNERANVVTGTGAVDHLFGGDGADTLIGNGGSDFLDGGGGVDILRGGPGDDHYYVDAAADLAEEEADAGTDTVTAYVDWTLATNFENLTVGYDVDGTGNGRANVILGSYGANTLRGEGGADLLSGGSGDDMLFGGADDDQIYGGEGSDQIEGGSGRDRIWTYGGEAPLGDPAFRDDTSSEHDQVAAGADDDYVSIGYGDDADGGTGVDTLRLVLGGAYAGAVLDTAAIVARTAFQFGGGTIQGFEILESIRGSFGSDMIDAATQQTVLTIDGYYGDDVVTSHGSAVVFNGEAGDDRLISGAAADRFDGGDGLDTIDYRNSATGVTVRLSSAAADHIGSGDGGDELLWVENAAGSPLNDLIEGSRAANYLSGGAGTDQLFGLDGNDVLDGGSGDDVMVGGNDSDKYIVDSSGDVVTELAGGGTDEVVSTISYVLPAEVENLQLFGTAPIYGIGNALDN